MTNFIKNVIYKAAKKPENIKKTWNLTIQAKTLEFEKN